jgi:hypothetical protein
MGSDCALYVPVSRVDELVDLVPSGFESVTLAPTCAYARAADPEWDVSRLGPLAATVSRARHEAIVLAYASVLGAFYYAHYRDGRPTRELRYHEGWDVVRGRREPWEDKLDEPPKQGADDIGFSAWEACDAIGEHYKLTGWFESYIAPTPKRPANPQKARAIMRAIMHQMIREVSSASLADVLAGVAAKVGVVRELIVQYPDYFMLLEEDGTPHIRTCTCKDHGTERELYVYDSEDSANRYATSDEAPRMRLHVSERMTGGALLETAAKLHATILVLNWLGSGLSARLVRETLASCDRRLRHE